MDLELYFKTLVLLIGMFIVGFALGHGYATDSFINDLKNKGKRTNNEDK